MEWVNWGNNKFNIIPKNVVKLLNILVFVAFKFQNKTLWDLQRLTYKDTRKSCPTQVNKWLSDIFLYEILYIKDANIRIYS